MYLLQEVAVPHARKALNSVVFLEGDGIIHQASADTEYATGDFARDQIAVALDMLSSRPDIARRTLISLAQKQGTSFDIPDTYPLTEVAPGRIHHERRSPLEPHHLRSLFSSDQDYQDFAQHCRSKSQRLINQWGEIYYGSVDATPKFLILAHEYLRTTHDFSILDQSYTGTDGKEHALRESLFLAADWINTNANYGPNVNPHDGIQHEKVEKPLVRFQRLNGLGIENQVMMDSGESFIFPDGTPVNHDFPVADTGVQGQAYNALLFAAQLLREHDSSEIADQKAKDWEETARAIQQNTLDLWMDDVQYFAMGEDISGPVPTLCANVVELLSSSIFDDLPDKQKYITGIVNMLSSSDFLTEVGIRTQALQHRDALSVDIEDKNVIFSGYHSADSVWLEKLRWFIRGLDYQGFHTLADQMRYTFLDAVNTEGSHTEFFWITPEGKPIYQQKEHIGTPGIINATSLSEREQAWTISAAIAIKGELGNPKRPHTEKGSWQEAVEEGILTNMAERGLYKQSPMKTRREIAIARGKYASGPTYSIDTKLGKVAQEALHERWRLLKEAHAA